MSDKYRVLFVCLGNICRSPLAEGIFKDLAEKEGMAIDVESAGTGNYHIGSLPDPRSMAVAMENGITLDQPARLFVKEDFDRFHLIVAMDEANYSDILKLKPGRSIEADTVLMRSYDNESNGDMTVPDPYYGNIEDFKEVFNILQRCNTALIKDLKNKVSA